MRERRRQIAQAAADCCHCQRRIYDIALRVAGTEAVGDEANRAPEFGRAHVLAVRMQQIARPVAVPVYGSRSRIHPTLARPCPMTRLRFCWDGEPGFRPRRGRRILRDSGELDRGVRSVVGIA